MLKIENVSGRLQTYVLTGKHLAAAAGSHPHGYKNVKRVTVHSSRDGKFISRVVQQPMADSLRLAAGETREVDDAIGYCPSIKAAAARGELRILRAVKPAEPTKPASA